MNIEDAKKTGAKALFGEKYGETVRVVCMGEFSKELCGGTHVGNTGVITAFKIISEAGIAAGVRRIEALTGNGVFGYYKDIENKLVEAARALKATPANLLDKISHLQSELKALQSENESLKSKAAGAALGDELKAKLASGVVVIASVLDGRVNLMAAVTDDLTGRGVHAGNIIKAAAPMVGGGGGGRPNMAQAGGKDPDGAEKAIEAAKETLASQL